MINNPNETLNKKYNIFSITPQAAEAAPPTRRPAARGPEPTEKRLSPFFPETGKITTRSGFLFWCRKIPATG